MALSENFIPYLLLFFAFYNEEIATSTAITCPETYSPSIGIAVKFPFRLPAFQPDPRCGYPGFDLSFNNRNNAVISLPSGDFSVKSILYGMQKLGIDDPETDCLPKRLLEKNFSVSGTSFVVENLAPFTFFNCSSNAVDTSMKNLTPVTCLSGDNFTVAAVPTELQHTSPPPPRCRFISTALFPVSPWLVDTWGMLLSAPIELTWKEPSCGDCEIGGGTCGFESDFGLQVACSNLQDHGLSRSAEYIHKKKRSAEYGIILTAAGVLLGVTCFMALSYISRRGRTRGHGGGEASATSGGSDGVGTTASTTRTTDNQQPVPGSGRAGLEDLVIESYPKTQVGEGGQLPKDGRDSSNTCSICLSKYKPKDTLRTIPQCRHFFHARCVDQWLRVNATCPLCRNLPQLRAR